MRTSKFFTLTIFVLFAILVFSSCAEVQNVEACATGHTYGFFGGLWHGIIVQFSYIR